MIVSWTGMRGVISLAAALALPLTTNAGEPFPERNLILFLTFCVILTTLVVQGLSLPALIRALGVEDDGSGEREETKGRIHVAQAALARLEELEGEDWVREDTASFGCATRARSETRPCTASNVTSTSKNHAWISEEPVVP